HAILGGAFFLRSFRILAGASLMNYLSWNEKTLTDFSEKSISDMYSHGYVFTRIGKGMMQQTRSVRIDLSAFELSSENKRILKKVSGINVSSAALPISKYDIAIGKMATDFYKAKFGAGIMSAQKIKEMVASDTSNFNRLVIYSNGDKSLGYAICY